MHDHESATLGTFPWKSMTQVSNSSFKILIKEILTEQKEAFCLKLSCNRKCEHEKNNAFH